MTGHWQFARTTFESFRFRRCSKPPFLCIRTIACLLLGSAMSPSLPAATITVNSAGDTIAVNGSVTLREAILSMDKGANLNADVVADLSTGQYGSSDTIHFAIGSGEHVIALLSELPAILKAMTIDGTSQPGYAGSPLISIDGSATPAGSDGLLLSSLVPTTVWALRVASFPAIGLRIGPNLDQIFGNGFDDPSLGFARPQQVATIATALDNVVIENCGSTGLEINDANVSVAAHELTVGSNGGGGILVGAGSLAVTGFSRVYFNYNNALSAHGVHAAPGATVTLTGTVDAPITIDSNGGTGLLVQGDLSSSYVQVNNNEQGVVVDAAYDPEVASSGSTAQNLNVFANGNDGLLVSKGRLDVSGASRFIGNAGVYAAQVASGAILTFTGANGAPIQVSDNVANGLLVRGNFSGTYVEVANNGFRGVVVDTSDEPVFPEGNTPTANAVLAAFDIHGNVSNGLLVLRTRVATSSMTTNAEGIYRPERFILKEGPAIATQSRVHDNGGDGITLGGDPVGLCPSLPQGCGAVDAIVQNTAVYGNAQGIVIQQQDAEDLGTVPNILRNSITENSGVGLHVHSSFVGFDANGLYINGNIIGHNGWPSPTCDNAVAETASQVLFDGPVAVTASLAADCSAHDTSGTCNADRAHTCLWSQAAADAQLPDPCRPSYVLSTNSCGSNANSISGYKGIGNPDLVVGVLAFDGAWVNGINVSWKHAGNLIQGQDWTAEGATSFFSDGPSGGELVCTAAISACPVHF